MNKKIKDIEFTKTSLSLNTGFVSLNRYSAQNIYEEGLSDKYNCDIVEREDKDAVCVIAYSIVNGECFVYLRQSIRPVIYKREKENGEIDKHTTNFIEVCAGIIEKNDGEGEDGIKKCAVREVEEELGFEAKECEIEILGAGSYSSPGLFSEKVYIATLCVNGKKKNPPKTDGSVMEEIGSVLEMSLKDALSLCETGKIRNAITEVSLNRLRNKLSKESEGETALMKSIYERRSERMFQIIQRLSKENDYYNRLIREFQANISHELKHPIAEMTGYINLLISRQDANLEDRKKWAETVKQGAMRLAATHKNLIEISSGDEIAPAPSRFSPAEEIAEVILDNTFLYDPAKVSVKVEVSSKCKELAGVRERFRMILESIISNALKFTKRGEVIIKVSPISSLQKGTIDFSPDLFNYHLTKGLKLSEIEILVSDTGVGIAPTRLKSIFKPYYQADGSSSRAFGGLGLGLSVVKRIVETMQGSIEVESEEGVGSRVRVVLPLGILS